MTKSIKEGIVLMNKRISGIVDDCNIKISSSQVEIAEVCDNLKKFLIEKNIRYGNSALEPLRIFSKTSTDEQILTRIDDKLNRIRNMKDIDIGMRDTIIDLMGYLVLLIINKEWNNDILEGLKDN